MGLWVYGSGGYTPHGTGRAEIVREITALRSFPREGVFFLLPGAAASGKSTYATLLAEHLPGVECHDADEMLAEDSDTRCMQLELWVQQALEAQRRGDDFLLTTHSPLGELLAAPSAPGLDGIAACLLDCADPVRLARMNGRGIDPRWPPTVHTFSWAAWHRRHAREPRWQPHVIDRNGPAAHRYDRWRSWTSDDPRWQVYVLDTSDPTVPRTLPILVEWVQLARMKPALLSPATGWWDAAAGNGPDTLP